MSGNRVIDAYLQRLDRALVLDRGTKVRVLEEIRDHLLSAVEEEIRLGCSPADAEVRAIERVGLPEEIAARFSLSERSGLPGLRFSRGKRRPHQKNLAKGRSSMAERHRTTEDVTECCAFCRKHSESPRELVRGPDGVTICPACLQLCIGIIANERAQLSTQPTRGTIQNTNPLACYCSFCGREHAEAERLIAGPKFVFICDRCVESFTVTSVGGAPSG